MATQDVTSGAPGRSAGTLATTTRRLATETKQAFKTTEFWAMVVTFVLILIAGNAIEGEEGGPDIFSADKVWLYITVLVTGYMVSRGLAKSGSRDPYDADRDNRDTR